MVLKFTILELIDSTSCECLARCAELGDMNSCESLAVALARRHDVLDDEADVHDGLDGVDVHDGLDIHPVRSRPPVSGDALLERLLNRLLDCLLKQLLR